MKISRVGVDLAKNVFQVRIPANVTAHSGHRDRLAHRCSLASAFLLREVIEQFIPGANGGLPVF